MEPEPIDPSTARDGRRAFRRVLVTGVGAVTPFGLTLDDSLRRLERRERALSETLALDGRPRPAGVIDGFEARRHFRLPKALKVSDRKTQLGVAAAAMALADAGFPNQPELRSELAVLFACAATDIEVDKLAAAVGRDPGRRAVTDIPYFAERVLRRLYPLWLLVNLPNMLAAQIGIQVEATGPNHTLLTEWIAGAQAIGEAFLAIRAGELDAAVTGGAESPLSPVYAGCLERQGLLRRERGDLVLAEAAAALVLEAAGSRPGATPERAVAEVTGYATAAPGAAGTARAPRHGASAPPVAPAIIRAARQALSMHARSLETTARAATRPELEPSWRVVGFSPPGTDLAAIARELLDGPFDAVPIQELMGHPLGAAGALAPALALGSRAASGDPASSSKAAPRDLLGLCVGYTGVGCALTLTTRLSHDGTTLGLAGDPRGTLA
jgi:3-oxoacyl-[acyl-carrier-protein] synthase II